jgi:hypothetical protein
VNAQPISAKSSGSQVAPDLRSNTEGSGFQSLFAGASRDVAGEDAGQNVPLTPEHDTVNAPIGHVGKKTAAASKAAGDPDSVLNALAAALVMPASAGIACADLGPSDDSLGGVTSLNPVVLSQVAGSPVMPNLEGGATSLSSGKTTVEGGTGFPANLQSLSLTTDVVGPDEPIARVGGDRKFPVAGSLSKQPELLTKTDDSLSPAAVKSSSPRVETRDGRGASPAHRQSSLDPGDTAPVTATSKVAAGNKAITGGEASPPLNTQAIGAITDASAAIIDPAARVPSVTSSAAEQKTDSNPIAKPGAGAAVEREDGVAAASPSRPALAVEPLAADRFARERRGSSFADAEESASDGDGFPDTAPGPWPPQTLVQAAGQAIGASTAHPSSPSPPIPVEHSSAPSTSPPDATPPPVAPALQTTQLLQRMDRAEIRIGLQSTDFGAIRLHTAVANDQVGAAVSTSHPALRDALLSEAPSLEKAMARHSLRLDSVSVDAGSANSDFNSFGSNERQPSQERLVSPAAWPAARLQQSQSAATAAPAGLEGSSRLDVRA